MIEGRAVEDERAELGLVPLYGEAIRGSGPGPRVDVDERGDDRRSRDPERGDSLTADAGQAKPPVDTGGDGEILTPAEQLQAVG